MKETLMKNNLPRALKVGEIVEGKIISQGRQAVFLDLGPWGTGIIYGKEFQESKNRLKNLKPGDTVLAKIIDLENEKGYVELSINQAGEEITWESLMKKKEKNESLKVKILGANKGGLLTEISGIPAFLPTSQLSPENYPRVEGGDSAKILKELQKFIGKEMEVKIFDLSQKEGKLILSEKAKELERFKEALKNYKVGDVIEGEITGVVDFGAFIVFDNGLEGLIHISELDWGIVDNPLKFVKVGEKVKAKIVEISNGRVYLSLKALKKDPWKGIEKKYKKGDIVKCQVTKINPFGALVKITPKIQGLVHISEFGTKEKMLSLLEVGKKYNFQISSIDPKEHRMSLKLVEEEKNKV